MQTFEDLILDLLESEIVAQTFPGVTGVFTRALNQTDPNGSIGLECIAWDPDETSIEMHGQGDEEPTFQIYSFRIQCLNKHGTKETGLEIHRQLAKSIRLMLYRDATLQIGLRALVITLDRTERFRTLKVKSQKFASTEMGTNTLVFLSGTEFTVITETV